MHHFDQVDLVSVVCDENPEVIKVDQPISYGTGDIRKDGDTGAFSPIDPVDKEFLTSAREDLQDHRKMDVKCKRKKITIDECLEKIGTEDRKK